MTLKYVGRCSGVVSYQDGSHAQFAAHIDERGNVSVNSTTGSTQAVLELQTDNDWLEDTLAQLSKTITLTPAGTAAKVVTSAYAEFSGRVAYANDTWKDFVVQYTTKSGAHVPEGGDNTVFADFPDAKITSLFEAIVGSGKVAIS